MADFQAGPDRQAQRILARIVAPQDACRDYHRNAAIANTPADVPPGFAAQQKTGRRKSFPRPLERADMLARLAQA
jgi:hypothetical protein